MVKKVIKRPTNGTESRGADLGSIQRSNNLLTLDGTSSAISCRLRVFKIAKIGDFAIFRCRYAVIVIPVGSASLMRFE